MNLMTEFVVTFIKSESPKYKTRKLSVQEKVDKSPQAKKKFCQLGNILKLKTRDRSRTSVLRLI